MGMANAMAYVSILLSILFTVYFYRKLAAARALHGAASNDHGRRTSRASQQRLLKVGAFRCGLFLRCW